MTEYVSTTTIPLVLLLRWKKQTTKPIDNLIIPALCTSITPNRTVRSTQITDTICTDIRFIFNSLTTDSLVLKKLQLTNVIIQKATNAVLLKEAATEILANFLVDDQNIALYLELFDCITKASIRITSSTDNSTQMNMGNLFLQQCKQTIFEMIAESNIKHLATMDLDDLDVLDAYNRERTKITNLIITICCLYKRKNTSQLHLKSINIYNLMKEIYRLHQKCVVQMIQLGDPMIDCLNEEEYEMYRKMINLYTEQMYIFMKEAGSLFLEDTTSFGTVTIHQMVSLFKTQMMPTITENYLISICNELFINKQ